MSATDGVPVVGPSAGRPDPDPTVLTTDALRREIASLSELVNVKLEVVNQRFGGVTEQFVLVERQRVEQKADTKSAVDAALTAQKEAVREQTTASALAIAKSETGTARQLEQLSATFKSDLAGVQSILTDLKDRVVKMEANKVGGQEQRFEARQVSAGLYALGGFLASLVIVGLGIVGFIAANN